MALTENTLKSIFLPVSIDPTFWKTNVPRASLHSLITTYIASVGGSGDMTKSVYDTNDNGIVDEAESAPWSGLTGVPSVFPPDTHTHAHTDITGLSAVASSGDYNDLVNTPAVDTMAIAYAIALG